jgi:hypothetical protein
MKPLFTVHGGEYIVGSHIEQNYRRINVWIPSRDTGIDLLISDHGSRHAVSLQVKFSKDFLVTHMGAIFQKSLRACGWWTINKKKLEKSTANLWVFVLLGFNRRSVDFIVIPPKELLRRLKSIHGPGERVFQCYLWVTEENQCWEARGLPQKDQLRIADGWYKESRRDFTKWLNAWKPVAKLNR